MRYLNGTLQQSIWSPKGSSCNLVCFSDYDFTRSKSDRKSTSGTCHLFSNYLVSWQSKKQYNFALSTIKAKYIFGGSCCANVLWLKQKFLDYDLKHGCILIKCDTTSAKGLTKNLVLHSQTKHIEIQYHFIIDRVEKGKLFFDYVDTKYQLRDIFTKHSSLEPFHKICMELGIFDFSCFKYISISI